MPIERFKSAVAELRAAVSELQPDDLSGTEAQQVVSVLSEGERLCQAGRALASARVLATRAWRAQGYRTPAEWLASRTQGSMSGAIAGVATAHLLGSLPATREAFVSGALSELQAAEISAAAAADPSAEASLLDLAARSSAAGLRERCRAVRAAAASDEDACERIRRGRYLRHWLDPDGAVRLDGRLAPDDGATLLARIDAKAEDLRTQALRSGQREPAGAYAADALVALARGESGTGAVVHLHVDQQAFERGHTVPGERCEIQGVGPVPVASAHRLAADGVIKALSGSDADVRRVAHLGRTIPARLRTALQARDRTCVVPGCDVSTGLEIDHIVPLHQGGLTCLENLCRLCRWHHAQKTHHGFQIAGPPGAWRWIRPGRGEGRSELGRDPPARAP